MDLKLTVVKELIDSLTEDEDLRQDLWVHFLSGYNSSTFLYKLEILHIEQKVTNQFQDKLGPMLYTPLSEEAEYALSILSPAESSVLYLFVLGLTLDEVSQYKGISPVRVHQLLNSIRSSDAWKTVERSHRCSRKNSPKKNALV